MIVSEQQCSQDFNCALLKQNYLDLGRLCRFPSSILLRWVGNIELLRPVIFPCTPQISEGEQMENGDLLESSEKNLCEFEVEMSKG